MNLVEAFELFCSCHKKEGAIEKNDETLRAWFLKAVAELKYCGILSAARTSTFLFKKNFFGKPQPANLI